MEYISDLLPEEFLEPYKKSDPDLRDDFRAAGILKRDSRKKRR